MGLSHVFTKPEAFLFDVLESIYTHEIKMVILRFLEIDRDVDRYPKDKKAVAKSKVVYARIGSPEYL